MNDLIDQLPKLPGIIGETLYMVTLALLFGGFGGLIVGLALYATRSSGVLPNRVVYGILNLIVNIFRPIPFIILVAALQPLARAVTGSGIGLNAVTFSIAFAAVFGISRLVEQNLVTVPPGVIEAARSMGAGPFRILLTVVVPEALGPLILGYTFAVVALVDMSAVAGLIGAGGLGNFAIQYGYRLYNPWVTWTAVAVIIIIVQLLQWLGNSLAKKVLRR
ncbi:ABC transporter permease [Agromyces atrinae]|uniref:methionine ABC transporter permease n=1 Tax=Agromyces atrinae TaxID=592376 RepID=UPI001F56F6F5|nr:methionine ABC transporter permease [Agromyces atrinae]MCI2959361.1 ABC transporter permease [Agromyces atrinae]